MNQQCTYHRTLFHPNPVNRESVKIVAKGIKGEGIEREREVNSENAYNFP